MRGYPRGLVAIVLGAVAATAVFPGVSAARRFQARSLALGRPVLRSEHALVDGTVRSRVAPTVTAARRELLVTYRRGVDANGRRLIRARAQAALVGSLPDLPVQLIRVARDDRSRAIARLRSEPGVRSVQPDRIEHEETVDCAGNPLCLVPGDPGFSRQWYLYNGTGTVQPPDAEPPILGAAVDAPVAWRRTLGSSAVRIAILDSGIDAAHPDLAGKVVTAANFTASNSDADASGHGTHVAGIAAATFDNGVGIAGMAPRAQLMNVKVLALDSSGQTVGDCAGVADGIVWATNHDANVLNLSLGGPSPCQAMTLAIDYAFSHGALVIAAAGNSATTSQTYPAADRDVISVAATNNRDQLASFSNRGASWVDLAAPGVGIVSTLPTYDNQSGAVGYGYLSGTSMAAPLVSGIAALIWGQMPLGPVNQEVRDRLFASAEPIAGTGSDYRYGLADACRAATDLASSCAPPPPTPTPIVEPPSPPPPTTAQPAPIGPPSAVPPHAWPGIYQGWLGRRRSALRLIVGARGDALTRVQTRVTLRCRGGRPRILRLFRLSTTHYGRIDHRGAFRLILRRTTRRLRAQRVLLTGRFDRRTRRAGGRLRAIAFAPAPAGRCESGLLSWHARLIRR